MNLNLAAFFGLLVVTAGLALAIRSARSATDPGVTTASQSTPFLGGFEPPTHAWSRFHIRYYAVVLLFVVFEMEMIFMYPWAVVFVEEGIKAMAEMGMFLFILALGVLYAWREGAFKWQ